MNNYGKVNQTNGASNFAYDSNQGNPSTVYNTAPKRGYGSLANGRPGVAPAPVNATPPLTGVPVTPRGPIAPPRNDIILDPRERDGFGGGGGGYGMPSQPPMAGYPGLPGLVAPRPPQPSGGLPAWPGMGNQGYWGQQRQQRRDRMSRFMENYNALQSQPRGSFLPYFGGKI